MSSQVLDNPGRNLTRALGRARVAWWLRTVRTTALWVVAAGALTVIVMWLAAWLQGVPGSLVDVETGAASRLVRPVAVVAATVLSLGLVVAAFAAPSLLVLARRLDVTLGQSQRLSTAYEVLKAGGPSTAVAYSLLEEVEKRSAHLDARGSGRAPHEPTIIRFALVGSLLGLAAVLLPVPERIIGVAQPTAPSEAPIRPDAPQVASVTEMAQILDLVAERSQSDYLRAVADSFAEFSARLATGSVTEAEAQRTSTELAQHLLAASREVGGAFQQAIESSLAAGASDRTGSPISDASGIDLSASSVSEAAPQTAAAGSGAAATESPPSIYMAFEKVIAEYEYDPSSLGLRPPGSERSSTGVESDIYGGVLTAQEDPNAQAPEAPFAGRVQGAGGGEVAGAAERSSDRAGDAAGAGGAELSAGAVSSTDGAAVDTTVAMLPHNEREGGSFTDVELLPNGAETSTRLALDLGAPQTFTRAPESSSAVRGIGGAFSDVVARYFTPATGAP